jgi:predicted HAD superfamily phosphohydrolase
MGQAVYMSFITSVNLATYSVKKVTEERTGNYYERLEHRSHTAQALILLGVPEEEREQFITEIDIENMSVRELKKAVKERDQALQDLSGSDFLNKLKNEIKAIKGTRSGSEALLKEQAFLI